MRVDTALTIVNNELLFYPGWQVSATDHSHRFEDTICLHFNLTDAPRTERELVRADAANNVDAYPEHVPGGAKSAWPLYVGDCDNVDTLVYRVIKAAEANFSHELREAARLRTTTWAPFHPHKYAGMQRWAAAEHQTVTSDFLFGLS
jgi:hypothetical protein